MRRRVMSYAQVEKAMPAGESRSVRFVVVEAIPTGDREQLAVGLDVTPMVASGEMPEGALRTHIKRAAIVPVDTGNLAALKKLDVDSATRDQYRRAFELCRIPMAAGNTSDHLRRVRDVVLAFAKQKPRAAA